MNWWIVTTVFLRFEGVSVKQLLIQTSYTEDTYNADAMGFPDEGEDGGDDHRGQGSTCWYPEKFWIPRTLKKEQQETLALDKSTFLLLLE